MKLSKKIMRRCSHGHVYGSVNLPMPFFRVWEMHDYNYVDCTFDEETHVITLYPRRGA